MFRHQTELPLMASWRLFWRMNNFVFGVFFPSLFLQVIALLLRVFDSVSFCLTGPVVRPMTRKWQRVMLDRLSLGGNRYFYSLDQLLLGSFPLKLCFYNTPLFSKSRNCHLKCEHWKRCFVYLVIDTKPYRKLNLCWGQSDLHKVSSPCLFAVFHIWIPVLC